MLEMSAVLGLLAGLAASGGTVVQLTTQIVLVAVVIVFGCIGFSRGAQREFLVTVAILFAGMFVQVGHKWLLFWVNRMYKMMLFVRSGGMGASDPSAAWVKVRALPDLIVSPQQQLYMTLAVFAAIVLLAYLLGELIFRQKLRPVSVWALPAVFIPTSPHFFARFLGLILGAVNGYLIFRFLVPRLFPAAKTVVVLPTGSLTDFLGKNINYVFIIIVAVLILWAWLASTGRNK
ncbi:MAG: hypothetical protein FJZ89_00715 [Chloroflexi bacterium]|nr:hypothetical protein [Chloroflexota bacterium]